MQLQLPYSYSGTSTTEAMQTFPSFETAPIFKDTPVSNQQIATAFQVSKPALNVPSNHNQQAPRPTMPGARARTCSPPDISSASPEQTAEGIPKPDLSKGNGSNRHKNSKHSHSQLEKWFCDEPECTRSVPGSGFKRRDNLAQHLSGVHKRQLESVRGRTPSSVTLSSSAVVSSLAEASGPTAASNSAIASSPRDLQPPGLANALGKRKREEEPHRQDTEGLAEQLTAERRKILFLKMELAKSREEHRRDRENMERQHREERQRWEDKYDELFNSLA
jgi:hypothetical protein